MLAKDILFGMKVLTLIGLRMTGSASPCAAWARAGPPSCLGVMGIGMVLWWRGCM
jgi:hypothetical protein